MPTFFDLFAGVGGFRLALEGLGWRCVGWCEVDKFCQTTYRANFDTSGDWFWPDATTLPTDQMPDFDVLCAGFPCQAFSLAGRRHGFEDARGTLVYEIFRILRDRRPRAFLLENVKGLVCRPMRDREFRYILDVLGELGYQVFWRVLDSKDYGVPQHRERVFIVGFREHRFAEFAWPRPAPLARRLADVLEREVPEKYYLSDRMVETLKRHLERHRAKGHGFGFRVHGSSEVCETLRSHGLGHTAPPIVTDRVAGTVKVGHCKIQGDLDFIAEAPTGGHTSPSGGDPQPKIAVRPCLTPGRVEKHQHGRRFKEDGEPWQEPPGVAMAGYLPATGELPFRIRRLTPLECFRLQGFPDSFVERARRAGVSDTQLYRQAGNAVTVNVVEAIGRAMERWLP